MTEESMTDETHGPTTTTRSVVIEKELPHPSQKIWRALTEGSLV